MSPERLGTTTKRPEKESPQLPKRVPVEDLQRGFAAQAEETARLAGETLSILETRFMDSPTRRILGQVFIGAPEKLVTGEEGRIEGQDWSIEDLRASSDRLMAEQEAGTRNHLAMEIQKAMSTEREFYRRKRKPIKQKADINIAFTLALLDRVLASKVNISESFPVPPIPEAYYEAQMLEIIRRTTLQSGYVLIEGVGEGSIRVVPSYEDDAGEVEVKSQQEINEGLKSRSRKEWDEIVEKQSTYIMEYLRILRAKANYESQSELVFLNEIAPRLTRKDKRAFSKRQIRSETERVEKEIRLWRSFRRIKDYDKILPWARRKLGEKADFKTLLGKLNREPTVQLPNS